MREIEFFSDLFVSRRHLQQTTYQFVRWQAHDKYKYKYIAENVYAHKSHNMKW